MDLTLAMQPRQWWPKKYIIYFNNVVMESGKKKDLQESKKGNIGYRKDKDSTLFKMVWQVYNNTGKYCVAKLPSQNGSIFSKIGCAKKIYHCLAVLSRCLVCGERYKFCRLLSDTWQHDWNTHRCHEYKTFDMVPTKQQKTFCAVEYAKTTSVITVQCNFRWQFEGLSP